MKSIICLTIFLFLIPSILAENLTEKDIGLILNIGSPFYINNTYQDIFKLTNNNHTSGKIDEINIIVYYNLTLNQNLIFMVELMFYGILIFNYFEEILMHNFKMMNQFIYSMVYL